MIHRNYLSSHPDFKISTVFIVLDFGGVKERYSLKGNIAMVEIKHVTPSHCLKSIINSSNYFTYRFICNLQSVNVLEFQQTGLTHCSRM